MVQGARPENPAKTFLKRYRAMMQRRESLQRSINEAYDRATNCTGKLKAIPVSGGGAAYDRMAEDVVKIADSTAQLKAVLRQIDKDLAEILTAIDAVPDETQKAVLTMRYVEGTSWENIQGQLGYERTQTLVVHGRGLWHVKQWLIKKGHLPE